MNRQELAQILVCANAFKEGDLLAGGTPDAYERNAARQRLAALSLADITDTTPVEDGVTAALQRSLKAPLAAAISRLTVDELKHLLRAPDCLAWTALYRAGLASKAIAAVVRVMTNDELSRVAGSLFNALPGAGRTIGGPRHFGRGALHGGRAWAAAEINSYQEESHNGRNGID